MEKVLLPWGLVKTAEEYGLQTLPMTFTLKKNPTLIINYLHAE